MKINLIDENGFYVEDQILPDEVIVDGESMSYPLNPNQIVDPVPDGFWHPRWDGVQWTEGLSTAEIAERKPPKPADYIGLMLALNDPLQPYKALLDSSADNMAVMLFLAELRSGMPNPDLIKAYWDNIVLGLPQAITSSQIKKLNGTLKKLVMPFVIDAGGSLDY